MKKVERTGCDVTKNGEPIFHHKIALSYHLFGIASFAIDTVTVYRWIDFCCRCCCLFNRFMAHEIFESMMNVSDGEKKRTDFLSSGNSAHKNVEQVSWENSISLWLLPYDKCVLQWALSLSLGVFFPPIRFSYLHFLVSFVGMYRATRTIHKRKGTRKEEWKI